MSLSGFQLHLACRIFLYQWERFDLSCLYQSSGGDFLCKLWCKHHSLPGCYCWVFPPLYDHSVYIFQREHSAASAPCQKDQMITNRVSWKLWVCSTSVAFTVTRYQYNGAHLECALHFRCASNKLVWCCCHVHIDQNLRNFSDILFQNDSFRFGWGPSIYKMALFYEMQLF